MRYAFWPPVTRRVTALWILCNLSSSWLLTAANKLLQLSRRLLTKAWMSVLVASGVSDCSIDLSPHRWKKQDRLSAAIWLVIVSWLFSRTPRLFTTAENETMAFGRLRFRTMILSMSVHLHMTCCTIELTVTVRSAWRYQLLVPRVWLDTFGTHAFSVAGPTVWNYLPDCLRDPAVDSEQFRRDLKTYLFAGHLRR